MCCGGRAGKQNGIKVKGEMNKTFTFTPRLFITPVPTLLACHRQRTANVVPSSTAEEHSVPAAVCPRTGEHMAMLEALQCRAAQSCAKEIDKASLLAGIIARHRISAQSAILPPFDYRYHPLCYYGNWPHPQLDATIHKHNIWSPPYVLTLKLYCMQCLMVASLSGSRYFSQPDRGELASYPGLLTPGLLTQCLLLAVLTWGKAW